MIACTAPGFPAAQARKSDTRAPSSATAARCPCSASRLRRRQQIQLVQHQPALFRGQIGAELLQFLHDGARILDRIGFRIRRGDIDQVQQQARALQVLEEPNAQPGAFRRALDQSGDVGHDETAMDAHVDHAQVRVQGRKRIVGNFRLRRRNSADQGRFAGIRQSRAARRPPSP